MERLTLDLGACGQGMPPDNAAAVGGSKSRVILLLHQGDDLAVVLDRLTLIPSFFALQWPQMVTRVAPCVSAIMFRG
jgi:hypothetical protein